MFLLDPISGALYVFKAYITSFAFTHLLGQLCTSNKVGEDGYRDYYSRQTNCPGCDLSLIHSVIQENWDKDRIFITGSSADYVIGSRPMMYIRIRFVVFCLGNLRTGCLFPCPGPNGGSSIIQRAATISLLPPPEFCSQSLKSALRDLS